MMQDIRIYDFEFNLLHIENRFTSSNWRVMYNDVGTFETHFDLDNDVVPIILGNKYLVAVQGNQAAIITGKLAINDLTVFGRTCNWILSRRVTPDFTKNDTAEVIARELVTDAFSDVANFTLGDLAGFSTPINFWRNTYNPTHEVIRDCMLNDNGGHEVTFDTVNKQWVFRCLKGVELPLIISEDNRNAYDTEYSEDMLNHYTAGWYETHPEIDDGEIVTDWIYLPGDTSKTGIYRWETRLTGETESEANSDLKNKRYEEKVLAKLYNLKYGTDYNLGDTVRIQVKKGAFKTTVQRRITGVNLWYEHNNIGEQPIFEED